MRMRDLSVTAAVALLLVGCASEGRRQGDTKSGEEARLFAGMGHHHRPISTQNKSAAKYFDQALTWTFAFNHDEAIRSYREAARLDPNLAMAWWGVALCNGPHINNPMMSPEMTAAAWDALQKAQALSKSASPVERDLINALSKRYANPNPPDRSPLDKAYADAMAAVWRAHPDDNDVGTLYAEALMDLQPWDLWTQDKQAKGNTREILAVLETVLKRDSNHPGANHLYIHSVEASAHADLAVASANRLRTLVPAAGHLVHMPAHIDVHVGGWAAAAETNEAAIKADAKYRAQRPKQGFYNIYMAHNHQFLAWAAMMEGRRAVAQKAAANMVAGVPAEFVKESPALVDPVVTLPLDVMMRFGLWDEILKQPSPSENLPISIAMWRFTRGVAQAALGDVKSALTEQSAFRAAAAKVPADAMMSINKAHQVLEIAEHVLAGEIAFRDGRIDDAVKELEAGVRLEDQLRYMEPPEWIQPVRHTLGAVLMSAGRYEQAKSVYESDLKVWPENGWSLYGLSSCLRELGAATDADAVERRFKKAWSRADTTIGTTCLCVTKSAK